MRRKKLKPRNTTRRSACTRTAESENRSIQSAVSGGFDALGGAEILDAVQGLVVRKSDIRRSVSQKKIGVSFPCRTPLTLRGSFRRWKVAEKRFGRSGRCCPTQKNRFIGEEDRPTDSEVLRQRPIKLRSDIDDEVRAFALGLIEAWVNDPSNVRLLRIGLDLWPADDVFEGVLELLRPFTVYQGSSESRASCCLVLPLRDFSSGSDRDRFRLGRRPLPGQVECRSLSLGLRQRGPTTNSLAGSVPWYLIQQVLLFMATIDFADVSPRNVQHRPPVHRHWELIRYLNGLTGAFSDSDFATLAVLSRRCFRGRSSTLNLIIGQIMFTRLEEIASGTHRSGSNF